MVRSEMESRDVVRGRGLYILESKWLKNLQTKHFDVKHHFIYRLPPCQIWRLNISQAQSVDQPNFMQFGLMVRKLCSNNHTTKPNLSSYH